MPIRQILIVALVVLAGCGEGDGRVGAPATSSEPLLTTTSFTPVTAAATTVTTSMVTTTASTARPPTRAEATSRLCAAVGSASSAFDQQSPSGLLRAVRIMNDALAANEKAAVPAVTSAARAVRSNLSLTSQIDDFDSSVSAASAACTKAGTPIPPKGNTTGPRQCIVAPC